MKAARCRNTYPLYANALELQSVLDELDQDQDSHICANEEEQELWILAQTDYSDQAQVEFWV
jgi:hypothetical protein